MKASRNYKIGGGYIPPISSNEVQVTIEFSSLSEQPVVSFADMKYNKRAGMMLVKDDGGASDYSQVFKILHGGLADDGITYEGIRYTDGCGILIEPHYSFAINTGNSRDAIDAYPDTTYWEQYNEMLQFGHSISNHSWLHGGYDMYTSIKKNETNIFDRTGYRTRTFVIPTADEGYASAAPSLGYKIVGSQFGVNSAEDYDGTKYLVRGDRVNVKSIDIDLLNRFLLTRNFMGDMTDTNISDMKSQIDSVFNDSVSGINKYMGHLFSHGITRWRENNAGGLSHYIDVLNHIIRHPNNNDNAWLPSMQEFVEYYETKLLVNKTEELTGNTLTVRLDLSNIPLANLTRDMSLIVTGGVISNVTVAGSDKSSYNTSNGLINIYLSNKNVANPYNDPIPPQIESAIREGNSIKLTITKPITQTKFSDSFGGAYTVDGNTVLSVTGSGTKWYINCQNALNSGDKFNYRMQRGDASDVNGVKMCTYIGYPLG